MKVLLIAYEFPPSASPQSLRWVYLSRELARLGHEVHVLTPDAPGTSVGGLPELPPDVQVHRTFAGPVMGLIAAHARRKAQAAEATTGEDDAAADAAPAALAPVRAHAPEQLNWKGKLWHAGLNWKGRLAERIKQVQATFTFPDTRGEWEPWGRRALLGLLDTVSPDVVISSHEPATTLRLGLLAKRRGFAWVADLGDPVLAPYTPKRWRAESQRLERRVYRNADAVLVTAASVARLLEKRHGKPKARVSVLTQGYDAEFQVQAGDVPDDLFAPDRLELLYTGSFYSFRPPDALVEAVVSTPGARLNIASIRVPDLVAEAAATHPESVRLLGFLPHRSALALQRRCDVLVNIGNDLPDQVPGKIYEYLGAGKPILHLRSNESDGVEAALGLAGRSVFCDHSAPRIRAVLDEFIGAQTKCREPAALPPAVSDYAWQNIGRQLEAILGAVAGATRRRRSAEPTRTHATLGTPPE